MVFFGVELIVWIMGWLAIGAICGIGELFCDWHRGCDIELKEMLSMLLVCSIGGAITAGFMCGSLFRALFLLACTILEPINFTIKGRKQK